jgi:mono/diheme cytochrome c family protein
MKPLALAALLLVAQAKTTQDAVFTAAQATRGETVYGQKCASCHGPDLAGDGQASPLAGKDFTVVWTDQSLGDLFGRIHATMPADAPGTLKPSEVADLTAFILQKNAFPEGTSELPAEEAALKDIKIIAPKQ